MKKIISLAVWGQNLRYKIGAQQNYELAKRLFPNWEIYIYTDDKSWVTFPCHVIEMRDSSISEWFWRFIPFFEIEGYILSRDADSRLSSREKKAVDEWIQSGRKFSIIRDHMRHFDFPMLAGMWGARTPLDKELLHKMDKYKHKRNYLADQEFLGKEIWPYAQRDVFIHDIISEGWFKSTRSSIGLDFVGQGYDENNNPIYLRD